jgi:hypothetical protein
VERPEDGLNQADYKNYRNVRAIALLFIILGSILFLGGIALATGATEYARQKQMHPLIAAAIALAGLAGVIGGIAIRSGNKRWAPLAKVMAWLYIWGFPIGTILSFTLLTGLSEYLKSVDRIRRSERKDDDRDEEDGDEREW